MMFSKIVHLHTTLRPGGGPQGYLFNLKEACQSKKSTVIEVKTLGVEESRASVGRRFAVFPNWIQRNIRPLKQVFNLCGLLPCGLEKFLGNSEEALCVHLAPYAARLLRKRCSEQIIFFMPHGPLSYSDELMNEMDLRYGVGCFSGYFRRVLNFLEKRIFSQVDGVVVACKEGLDAYFDGKLPECTIYEVLSGVSNFENNFYKAEARKFLNLPDEAKVFGFFGRFNKDKGFDFFLEAIKKIDAQSNVIFISAGSGPIEPISHSAYVNYGWRSDINLLISACDAVVLPNRATYFDLLPLEVMSIGRPVLASKTGGNVKLKKLAMQEGVPEVVQLFELNVNDIVSKLRSFINKSFSECHVIECEAMSLYCSKFSSNKFYENHVIFFNKIKQK